MLGLSLFLFFVFVQAGHSGVGSRCNNTSECETNLVCDQTKKVCSVRVSGLNQGCGGFIIHPAVCDSGLFCKINKFVPDVGGICLKVPVIQKGGKCNNISLYPQPVCDKDLVCYNGVCHPLSKLNGPCGGFVSNPAVCDKGLICQLNKIPDIGGKCVKIPQYGDKCSTSFPILACDKGLICSDGHCHPLAKLGQTCGQAIQYPQICDKGLVCVLPTKLIPGQGGKCLARLQKP